MVIVSCWPKTTFVGMCRVVEHSDDRSADAFIQFPSLKRLFEIGEHWCVPRKHSIRVVVVVVVSACLVALRIGGTREHL